MASIARVLGLRFLPVNADLALLVLRVWFGGMLLMNHGWAKVSGYSHMVERFPDPLGIGVPASLALSAFAETICSSFIAVGLFTRFAAVVCIINMTTAFVAGHGAALSGPRSGELPFMYLGAFVAILLAGAGRYSLDGKG
jgi:putative oxidoreductase